MAASEKTTYRFDVDYAKLSEGYRAIKREMAEAEKAAKAVAKEQQRLAKETAREQERAAKETASAMERAWKSTKDAQKQALRDGLSEMKAASKEHDDSVKGMSARWASLGTSVLGAIGAMASISSVLGVLRDIQERFKGISESADATAKAMLPLSTQVAGKGGPAEVRKIALAGASFGLTPEETGTIGNTLKSIQGASIEKDLPTIAKLSNLGVAGQDAAPIAQAGIVRGLGSARASDLALKAADLSSWDVSDVARVMPKTMLFSSMESGLAAGSALAEAGVVKEQLPAQTEALSRVLNKDKSPLSRKFKLAGLSESERIDKLSAAADASGNRGEFLRTLPEKYKLGEEEGRALRAVLSLGGKFGQYERDLKATPAGELDARYSKVMEDPMQRRAFDARKAAAVARYQQDFGPMADAAEQERARIQTTGMRFQTELPPEVAAAMTDQEGKANWLGRGWSALQGIGFGSGLAGAARFATMPGSGGALGFTTGQEFLPSVFGRAPGGDSEAARTEKTDALLRALEANTQATMDNTKATGGGDAVGVTNRNADL